MPLRLLPVSQIAHLTGFVFATQINQMDLIYNHALDLSRKRVRLVRGYICIEPEVRVYMVIHL